MPSVTNILICVLALLSGILIGEKYRKWKQDRSESNHKTGISSHAGRKSGGADERGKV